MIIRCTKDLLKELDIKSAPETTAADSFWNCHATIFRIERHKCILVTSDLTLYSIFIPGLRKTDFRSLKLLIGEHFFKNLLFEGVPQNQIEIVLPELQNIVFDKSSNRSVLGSMTELRKCLEYEILMEEGLENIDLHQLNGGLNRVILGAIDHLRPIDVLRNKLAELVATKT